MDTLYRGLTVLVKRAEWQGKQGVDGNKEEEDCFADIEVSDEFHIHGNGLVFLSSLFQESKIFAVAVGVPCHCIRKAQLAQLDRGGRGEEKEIE